MMDHGSENSTCGTGTGLSAHLDDDFLTAISTAAVPGGPDKDHASRAVMVFASCSALSRLRCGTRTASTLATGVLTASVVSSVRLAETGSSTYSLLHGELDAVYNSLNGSVLLAPFSGTTAKLV